MTGELDNVARGPGPKDQAVAGVREARLDAGVLQPRQKRVDKDFVEVGREELVLLLAISGQAVRRIQCLDLGL